MEDEEEVAQAALVQLLEMQAFERTGAGRSVQASEAARNIWAFMKRDVERRAHGAPITPLPGNPNP